MSQRKNNGRIWLPIGTVNGFIAVLAAASISHRLIGDLESGGQFLFQMAVIFHLAHALTLILIGVLWRYVPRRLHPALQLAGASFTLGIILFCGSLYFLSVQGPGSLGVLSFLTPVGGTCLFIGWLALSVTSFRAMGGGTGRGLK